ncbi:hypothetical protein NN561_002621 [Cricetulus griseus]
MAGTPSLAARTRPVLLLLVPWPPRRCCPATRSPWALSWSEVLRQPRGRGVRTSPSAPSTFPPFPSLPRCWQTPRRLSIPNARSKSEPGARLSKAGPRLPLGAAGEGVGTAGESRRGRGWPGAGADVGRGWRPRSFSSLWAAASGARWPTLVPILPTPGARTWTDSKNQR